VRSVVALHFEVRPRRQLPHVPQDTAHGTTTMSWRNPANLWAYRDDLGDTFVSDGEWPLEWDRAAEAPDHRVDCADRHAELQGS
jgi:hypothetical protein